MYTVTIYAGGHYTDAIKTQYKAIGSIDQIKEGARIKCEGRRLWVDLHEGEKPVTHWIFNY